MQNLLTLGVEENEMNLTFTDRIVDPGFQVEFDDVQTDNGLHGYINDIYVTDAFGTRKHINGIATIDKVRNYVSLHLMSGVIEHKSIMHAIYAALHDFAGNMKPKEVLMCIELGGYKGLIVSDKNIFTGTITDAKGVIFWVDGCDVLHEMQTWVLQAFKDFVATGVMPTCNYGD